MTITIGWIRRNRSTSELLIASDSRLRSRGPMSQTQKLFPLLRGDCCLGFAGDAQIAYPLFMQVGSALNNFIRTRSRATDVTDVAKYVGDIVNNLISSWELSPEAKLEELSTTKILFGGWSWKHAKFTLGVFLFQDNQFSYHRIKARVPHPWRETRRSLVFIGDYMDDYMGALDAVLLARHGKQPLPGKKIIDFDYEPIEALNALLTQSTIDDDRPAIGGAPQMLKCYSFANSLPIVIKNHPVDRYLLGRKLFAWEKTEYPVLDLTKRPPSLVYPMSHIPLPALL